MFPAETVGGRRAGSRLAALSPGGLHSPRRSSEDSADDVFNIKDLRVSDHHFRQDDF